MIFGLSLELLLSICLLTTAAAKPHSIPVVLRPTHRYDHGPSTPPLFQPVTLLPDTLIPSWTLKAVPTTIYRPRSIQDLHHTPWDPIEVLGPDIEDRHTLAQLARMSGNAYALPGQKNWYDLDSAWNTVSHHCLEPPQLNHRRPKSFPFGWEDRTIGFRGHVFLSSDNNTVVLSIKGTTLQGPTSKKDKFNDNLLFSCCCARVDFSWIFSTVCDCYSGHWTCDNRCLTKALIEESLFYSVGMVCVEILSKPFSCPCLTHTSFQESGQKPDASLPECQLVVSGPLSRRCTRILAKHNVRFPRCGLRVPRRAPCCATPTPPHATPFGCVGPSHLPGHACLPQCRPDTTRCLYRSSFSLCLGGLCFGDAVSSG
jgi:hypothetical protein